MTRAIGIGFALLLFYVALHTLPVQWFLTILILSGAVTLAFLPKPERDPRYWLPPDYENDVSPWCSTDPTLLAPWTLDDERAMAADRDYDEERSE